MSWKLPTLASIAGGAGGSVITWMIMDNQAINAKRLAQPIFTTQPAVATEPTVAEKKAFFGIAAATTAGLALIRFLDRQ